MTTDARRITLKPGAPIDEAIGHLVFEAKACGRTVVGSFEGVDLEASPGSDPADILAEWKRLTSREGGRHGR